MAAKYQVNAYLNENQEKQIAYYYREVSAPYQVFSNEFGRIMEITTLVTKNNNKPVPMDVNILQDKTINNWDEVSEKLGIFNMIVGDKPTEQDVYPELVKKENMGAVVPNRPITPKIIKRDEQGNVIGEEVVLLSKPDSSGFQQFDPEVIAQARRNNTHDMTYVTEIPSVGPSWDVTKQPSLERRITSPYTNVSTLTKKKEYSFEELFGNDLPMGDTVKIGSYNFLSMGDGTFKLVSEEKLKELKAFISNL